MKAYINVPWPFVILLEGIVTISAFGALGPIREARMWEAFADGERLLSDEGVTAETCERFHAAAKRGHWKAPCREAMCGMLGITPPGTSSTCPEHGRDVLKCIQDANQTPHDIVSKLPPDQIKAIDIDICNQIAQSYRIQYRDELPNSLLETDGCLYRAACEGNATWVVGALWRALLRPTIPSDKTRFEKGFHVLQAAAKNEDAEAATLLGTLYEEGKHIPQDLEKSTQWLEVATKLDSNPARIALGRHYLHGIGCTRDVERAAQTLTPITATLSPKITFEIGECYLNGDNIVENQKNARFWLRLAARKGSRNAKAALVKSYQRDRARPATSNTQEKRWILELVTKGDWEAVALHQRAWPDASSDLANVIQDLAEANNLQAQLWLASYYEQQGNEDLAMLWYNKATTQDSHEALRALAQFHMGKNQDKLALQWAEIAWAKGVTDIDGLLGELLYTGRGGKQDYNEAVKFLSSAAQHGDANAQWRLWMCYRDGTGVNVDLTTARQFLDMAIKAAYIPAIVDIGLLQVKSGTTQEERQQGLNNLLLAAQKNDIRAQEAVLRHCIDADVSPAALVGNKEIPLWLISAVDRDSALAHYVMGKWYSKNTKEAYEHFRKSALAGNPKGKLAVAKCLSEGRGVKQSLREALDWYEQVVTPDNAELCATVGHLYYVVATSNEDYANSRKWYGMAAERGIAKAQYALGVLYETGKGGEIDFSQAAQWYEKVATQGDDAAQCRLGILYFDGKGVPKDESRALALFKQSAEQGNSQADYRLGLCHYLGHGTPQDLEVAVQYFKKATESDYAVALFMLGELSRTGVGMEKNYEKAVAYYKKASKEGFAKASLRLGDCYSNGKGVKRDTALAYYFYRKAYVKAESEKASVPEIWWKLGRCYAYGLGVLEDRKKGVELIRRAAETGETRAYCDFGLCHYKGIGTKQDFAQAIVWFQKALDSGDLRGAYWLGECTASGAGVDLDDARAVEFYRQAAEAGYAEAQLKMYFHYSEGLGVEQDDEEAVKWVMQAARQEHPHAEYLLAMAYAEGKGIQESEELAFRTMRSAAKHGSPLAEVQLGEWYSEGYGTEQNRQAAEYWRQMEEQID